VARTRSFSGVWARPGGRGGQASFLEGFSIRWKPPAPLPSAMEAGRLENSLRPMRVFGCDKGPGGGGVTPRGKDQGRPAPANHDARAPRTASFSTVRWAAGFGGGCVGKQASSLPATASNDTSRGTAQGARPLVLGLSGFRSRMAQMAGGKGPKGGKGGRGRRARAQERGGRRQDFFLSFSETGRRARFRPHLFNQAGSLRLRGGPGNVSGPPLRFLSLRAKKGKRTGRSLCAQRAFALQLPVSLDRYFQANGERARPTWPQGKFDVVLRAPGRGTQAVLRRLDLGRRRSHWCSPERRRR